MSMVFAIEQKTLYSVFNAAKKTLFEPSYISAYSYPCKITHIIVYHPHTKNQDMNSNFAPHFGHRYTLNTLEIEETPPYQQVDWPGNRKRQI